jgi:hypothetical protein
VSAAEEMAFGGTDLDVPIDRGVAEQRIADITAGSWWRSCGPPVTVSTPRAGIRSSTARDDAGRVGIQLSDEQLTLSTVAHELAHALAGTGHGHDATFRAAYVDVVAVLAGAVSAEALNEAFAAMGVSTAERRWPRPHRAVGDGFVVTT